MNEQTNDNGGPAFPFVEPETPCNVAVGMTLRDYFAAKAMQSAFGNPIASSADEKEYIATHAYQMANAMLRAREAS